VSPLKRLLALVVSLLALGAGPATAQAQLPELPPVPDLPEAPGLEELGDQVEGLLGEDPGTVLDHLRFEWVTRHADDPVRTHEGVIAVPQPLDVAGSPAPDVLAQLQIDAGRATLRVTKLATADGDLPLAIEAVLRDPRGGSDLYAAFGYDTRDSRAPGVYDATLALVGGTNRVTTFTLDTRIADAGPRLAVTGEVFTRGEDGSRVDPQRVRLGLSPVPAVFHAGVIAGSDLGTSQSGLELATETPTVVTVVGEDVQGSRTQRLDASIDKLPNSLSLILTDASSGQRTLSYTASERVAAIDASVVNTRSGDVENDLRIGLDELPTTFQFIQDTPTHARLEANEPIGAVEFGSATGGSVRTLDDPAYVYSYQQGSVDSLAVRVLGLKRAEVDTGDPLVVDAELQAGPFRALIEEGARRIDAAITDLPGQVHVAVSPSNGTLSYTGSAPIGEIRVVGTDPAGFSGRATKLDLLARDVPTSLDLSYADSGGQVTLDAGSGQVGLLEVQLTSGPDERLDPSVDGILLHDLADRYVVFGRVTNLRKVSVTQRPTPDLLIDTAGGRIFRVDFDQLLPSGKVQSIDGKIDKLQPATRLRLIDDAQGKRVTYDAAAATGEITIDGTNVEALGGRAKEIHVLMRTIPQSLVLGLDDGTGKVNINAGGQTLGLLEAQLTSGPNDRIQTGFDGILLNDLASKYVLFARVTGLRSATAVQSPAPDLTLDATGDKVFKVDVNQQPLSGGKTTFTRATLDRLKPNTRVRVIPTSAGQRIEYTASARTNSLSFETNSGDRWKLDASVAGPLPASVVICQAGDKSCGGSGRTSNAGSVSFIASEHTTVNVFDCVRPASSSCPSSPDEFLEIKNLRVRDMIEDAHANDSGYSGHIYLDTNNHTMSGDILNRDGSGGFRAHFPSGFKSQNRLGTWSAWGLFKSKSGTITCPSGTSLDVRVLGLWIGVTGYLC